jgi:hypothetical protein
MVLSPSDKGGESGFPYKRYNNQNICTVSLSKERGWG